MLKLIWRSVLTVRFSNNWPSMKSFHIQPVKLDLEIGVMILNWSKQRNQCYSHLSETYNSFTIFISLIKNKEKTENGFKGLSYQ